MLLIPISFLNDGINHLFMYILSHSSSSSMSSSSTLFSSASSSSSLLLSRNRLLNWRVALLPSLAIRLALLSAVIAALCSIADLLVAAVAALRSALLIDSLATTSSSFALCHASAATLISSSTLSRYSRSLGAMPPAVFLAGILSLILFLFLDVRREKERRFGRFRIYDY
jgi:hypothetical protein